MPKSYPLFCLVTFNFTIIAIPCNIITPRSYACQRTVGMILIITKPSIM